MEWALMEAWVTASEISLADCAERERGGAVRRIRREERDRK
jgi:hypothetical protein